MALTKSIGMKKLLWFEFSKVKNLRSQVSRSGICCLGDMYTILGKNMDNVSKPFSSSFAFFYQPG